MSEMEPVRVTPDADGLEPAEELRLLALLRVHELSGGDPSVEVRGGQIAQDLELSLQTSFAIVEYLSRKGFLDYHGAGPRVSITPLGLGIFEGSVPLRPPQGR